jgi:hypothetical protein
MNPSAIGNNGFCPLSWFYQTVKPKDLSLGERAPGKSFIPALQSQFLSPLFLALEKCLNGADKE